MEKKCDRVSGGVLEIRRKKTSSGAFMDREIREVRGEKRMMEATATRKKNPSPSTKGGGKLKRTKFAFFVADLKKEREKNKRRGGKGGNQAKTRALRKKKNTRRGRDVGCYHVQGEGKEAWVGLDRRKGKGGSCSINTAKKGVSLGLRYFEEAHTGRTGGRERSLNDDFVER